jgi:alpha-tubulin suppressor-like RCC1 family protein
MEREIEQRKINEPLWPLIASIASIIMVLALVPGIYSPAQAEMNRNSAIAAGLGHSCVVISDGTVQCWGFNRKGQLGNGTTAPSSVRVTVSGLTNAVAVTSGFDHTCALLADGTVQCWGSNSEGQLGDGTMTDSLVPVTVNGITTATAVGSGSMRTCAVLSDGTVRCWGGNYMVPVTINGITDAVAVAGSCVVSADGRVQCWRGSDLVLNLLLRTVRGITNAVAISNSGAHTCVVLADGHVQCWGRTPGNGTTTDSSIPVTVSGITDAVVVAIGSCNYTCAVLANGRVQCWGHNLHFATSMNGRNGDPTVPVTVTGITNAVAVAAQDLHPCALLADGLVQCWGYFLPNELGNGTKSTSSAPVTVKGLTKVQNTTKESKSASRMASFR